VSRVQASSLDEYLGVDLVSDNYFSLLGLRAARGGVLGAGGTGGANAVVISDAFWTRAFNRSDTAIGQSLLISGVPFTVVGIAPSAFNGIGFPSQFAMAIPIEGAAQIAPSRAGEERRGVRIIARMPAGGTRDRAAQALSFVLRACCGDDTGPLATAGRGASVSIRSIAHGIPSAKDDPRAAYRRILILLMCGVSALLLITCVNVANLLMSRA